VEGDLVVRPDLTIPDSELEESVSRSGGPGGQHVNKTSTRVTLRWSIATSAALTELQRQRLLERLAPRLTKEGELVLSVDASRSQLQNREAARERLAHIVSDGLKVPTRRVKTKPTKGSSQRRIDTKKKRSSVKKSRGPVTD
jgi:ribosome-associated protein